MDMFEFSEDCLKAYNVVSAGELKDIGSEGYLLEHRKSGARISLIKNDDNNKVFYIGFRTPVSDSTGVAHIIEHSVLCGSEKYPVKDPFVELVKGSLNTFLNAMTYSDKTVYPVASCNSADFANLMSVYMDAVFFPRIYDIKEIFMQEGWHYEMESADSPITINGVVYNEMRGVYSSPDQILGRYVQKALFPDTTYNYDSGGEPDCIPKLTYEQFLDFHKKYYHPSNSYIYLYGDVDMEERLLWLDENYLSKFDRLDVDSAISIQKPFDKIKYVSEKYSAQSENDKSYLSYNCVIDTSLNVVYQTAFQILMYALIMVPGAPVKKALLDAGIAEDISCVFDGELYQPVFSIIAKEADESRNDEFVKIIRDTLTKLADEGIDRDSLRAAISIYEFRYREADYERFPKGLMYGLTCMQSWLYDDNEPFSQLLLLDVYDRLKNEVDTGYFEKLIKDYLLDNTHCAVVSILPETDMNRRLDEEMEKRLAEYKKTLSDTEIRDIVNNTKKLYEYQETPDTEEQLKVIPMLTIDDIDKDIRKTDIRKKSAGSVSVLHSNINTNGIAYVIMSFDISDYEDYVQYITLLSSILAYVDTEKYDYMSLANAINLHTGGINVETNVYAERGNADKYRLVCEVSFSCLYSELYDTFQLVGEIMDKAVLNDKKRLKEIIQEERSVLRGAMEASGNNTAVERGLSYASASGRIQGRIGTVGLYRFIDSIYNHFDEYADGLIDIFEILRDNIFRKDRLFINITASEEGYSCFEKEFKKFDMYSGCGRNMDDIVLLNITDNAEPHINEGFKTSGKVQYVARTGNFIKKGYEYSGTLRVVKTLLSYGYLWVKVRVQGGAYGIMCNFSRSGNGYFVSYRDPNLSETNKVFMDLPEYLGSFEAGEREMTGYILGTISMTDMPSTPAMKGKGVYIRHMCKITDEDRMRERKEILSTDARAVRKTAELVKAILDNNNICVVGSAAAIEENAELFDYIEDLI